MLVGEDLGELGGSEYLNTIHGLVQGEPPKLDLDREGALITLLTRSAAAGLLQSAHDCSDGGLAVTLAECAFDTGGIGLEVDVSDAQLKLRAPEVRVITTLFSESASRAVVSVRPEDLGALQTLAAELGIPATRIGRTSGSRITIAVSGTPAIDCAVAEAEQIWANALGRYFAGRAA